MEIMKFYYEGKEKEVLIDSKTENDLFGYDLNYLEKEEKEIIEKAIQVISNNKNKCFRHYKKNKINPPQMNGCRYEKPEKNNVRFEV